MLRAVVSKYILEKHYVQIITVMSYDVQCKNNLDDISNTNLLHYLKCTTFNFIENNKL